MAKIPREKVNQILIAHASGKGFTAIANELGVDKGTVASHVEKFTNVYGSTSQVFAIIRPVQRACVHPSMKCSVCGQAQDAIHRRELETIERLTNELIEIKRRYNLIGDDGV